MKSFPHINPLTGLREHLERVGDCLAHEAVLLLAFDPLLEPSAEDEHPPQQDPDGNLLPHPVA